MMRVYIILLYVSVRYIYGARCLIYMSDGITLINHSFQSTMALLHSDLPGLTLISQGKVRDIYCTSSPEHLLFVASDRISAYDLILKNVRPTPPLKNVLHTSHLCRVSRTRENF